MLGEGRRANPTARECAMTVATARSMRPRAVSIASARSQRGVGGAERRAHLQTNCKRTGRLEPHQASAKAPRRTAVPGGLGFVLEVRGTAEHPSCQASPARDAELASLRLLRCAVRGRRRPDRASPWLPTVSQEPVPLLDAGRSHNCRSEIVVVVQNNAPNDVHDRAFGRTDRHVWRAPRMRSFGWKRGQHPLR
jgi:hypothetical protein